MTKDYKELATIVATSNATGEQFLIADLMLYYLDCVYEVYDQNRFDALCDKVWNISTEREYSNSFVTLEEIVDRICMCEADDRYDPLEMDWCDIKEITDVMYENQEYVNRG